MLLYPGFTTSKSRIRFQAKLLCAEAHRSTDGPCPLLDCFAAGSFIVRAGSEPINLPIGISVKMQF